MFIGREKELATLNGLYNSDKFEFAVIYGRRRVGKTAFISHFIQDKKAIYVMGVESNEKQNLENFSQAIMEYASGIMPGTSFVSFQAAIEYVFKLCENERLVLVIDEYPYVAKASKSMASTLQMLIDKNMKKSDLKEKAGISSASLAKLGKGDNITTDVLLRICEAMDCRIEDILETVRD